MAAMEAAAAAHWFVRNEYDNPRNTRDGNMKLQKLLYFSQLVHLAKYGRPLFDEDILAFENGSVVEEVRHQYQWNYDGFIAQSLHNEIEMTDDQRNTLELVKNIFGNLSAQELSEINHHHTSWKESYHRSIINGRSWKDRAHITIQQLMLNEVDGIKELVAAYEEGSTLDHFLEIKGIKFYYNPDEIELNHDIMKMLESFDGEDSAYTIYKDESVGLVIY